MSRIGKHPDTPCSVCGKLLYTNPTSSLPAGQRICRPCRTERNLPAGNRGVPLITHGGKPSGTRWRRMQEQVWATETHCAFCGEHVDQTLHHNHSMARSVDHAIPIAHGGAMYDRDNLRLAHRTCNAQARATNNDERVQLLRVALWLATVL